MKTMSFGSFYNCSNLIIEELQLRQMHGYTVTYGRITIQTIKLTENISNLANDLRITHI